MRGPDRLTTTGILRRRQLLQLGGLAAGGVGAAWLLKRSVPLGRDVGQLAIAREVLADPDAPTLTPAAFDLTMAVFTDYRCPACRLAHPAMMAAARDDGRVRLLFLDWPVFGGISVQAARVALAAAGQGRYLAAHDRLMTDPRPLDDSVLADIAAAAGADPARLTAALRADAPAIDRRLAANASYALQLGLPGTPGYLIGPVLIAGALSESEFVRAFRQARAAAAAS